ncbi:toll-like receptor 1 [Stegastes partitus]|uniref:Toll-like receptor 1 n=1 Tax=Stegastes partitus TaxID=144197 RepID=A0A3B5A105_9TELE|nr:PREDICTED: toll-like receptor 1 [Stegastes partitus]XP_008288603.1 PREDICTED: toll-like receptor 1 [Stegastes partitus]XP_008288611.1 PREDICTED: toll-like receptor 1 [Stegastes partitus]
MSTQSTSVVLLIGTIVIVSLKKPDCTAVKADYDGFKLCVTSRRGMEDLSHQNLTDVPSNLSNNTQYLDISHNFIQSLNEAQFSRLFQLCFLKVTHCGLQEISPTAFIHTPALKVLNISHNDLRFVPDISVKKLKILDLGNNLFTSYRIPESFQKLSSLDLLSIGSTAALSVSYNDFDPLMNVHVDHLVLGGGLYWQNYDSGSLAKLKSLQKVSIHASFCGNFRMFEKLLVDLNVTQAKSLRFIALFPDSCHVDGDPFKNLRTMPFIQNLTIENTWINSSFMEVFLKNVWLSSLYDLSFVNMTYNEDTPDGFQFLTINHTINLCSITFSGVNHYQYKYPTFNMSFEAVSRLTYLKFSGSGMNILPCRVMSALPSLETLDLSDNLLTESGFWWFMCKHTSVFPRLRRLSLSKNRFSSLSFISQKMHEMKTLESLDLSFNSIYLDGDCSWPAWMTELNLGNNNLGNSVFRYLSSNFEKLDLSKTGITAITQEYLSHLPKLTYLKLSSNSIQVIPADLSLPTLLSLHIDQNALTSISREALAGFSKIQTLKAGGNPFVCSCDSYWFVATLNKSLLLDWPLDYTCSTPPSFAGLSLSEFKTSELSCEAGLQVAVALPVMIVISAAIGLVFYKCDGVWYTKMLWVWIRMKRRGKKCSNILKNASFDYHAFISYSHQDSDWVDSQLLPSMEGAGFSLCVHERDFVPGEWIIDNIINCVESSYKTLFVLSRHFVQSEWCNYELFFAQHRAISVQRDSLVFILLEPIPTDCIPKKFLRLRSILRQQTYLEWPNNERKQQVFWKSLKSMLHMADRSVALKDAALGILDQVPLLTDNM